MLDFQDIGVKVTHRRHELKLSQTALAQRAGVVRQTIARIERGEGGSVASGTLLSVLNALSYDLVLEFGLRGQPEDEVLNLDDYLDRAYYRGVDEW